MNFETIKELVDNLPKCERKRCTNIATYHWLGENYRWYGDTRIDPDHLECDHHTMEYGRDWTDQVSNGWAVELPYAPALRKLLKSKPFRVLKVIVNG